jgi:acyl-CoA dehydrogenase
VKGQSEDPVRLDELRAAARDFVRSELAPLDQQIETEDHFPEEARARLAAAGYFGLNLPQEYGGRGLGVSGYCAVLEELGSAHAAYFFTIDDNNGLGAQLLLQGGTPEQCRRYLPDMASGRVIASFALTEPEAGSDAGAIRTYARPDGDAYVLNGRKRFIGNGASASYFTVIARTRHPSDMDAGITAFIVERDTAGFSIGPRQPMMGLRGSFQHELEFEDCRIPEANRVGAEGEGLRLAFDGLNLGRLAVAAWATGVAAYALELGVAYARDRHQFGQPIGQFQGVQWLLADSAAELAAARALLRETAATADRGGARRRDCAMVKLFTTEAAGRIVDRMLQVHGGAGYAKGAAIERLYRDIRIARIIEGTSEIQRSLIARSLLREASLTPDEISE